MPTLDEELYSDPNNIVIFVEHCLCVLYVYLYENIKGKKEGYMELDSEI